MELGLEEGDAGGDGAEVVEAALEGGPLGVPAVAEGLRLLVHGLDAGRELGDEAALEVEDGGELGEAALQQPRLRLRLGPQSRHRLLRAPAPLQHRLHPAQIQRRLHLRLPEEPLHLPALQSPPPPQSSLRQQPARRQRVFHRLHLLLQLVQLPVLQLQLLVQAPRHQLGRLQLRRLRLQLRLKLRHDCGRRVQPTILLRLLSRSA